MTPAPARTPPPLALRQPDHLDLAHARYALARDVLARLGYDVADLEHLDPGDVAMPLALLEDLARAASWADDVYPRGRKGTTRS